MIAMVHNDWPILLLLLAALLAIMLLARWMAARGRTDRRRRYHAPDALDAGAAPATRNQAFIDAPSAAALAAGAITAPLAATGPDILGGIGEIAAWGAAREVGDREPFAADVEPEPVSPPTGTPDTGDDLTRIKGVGAKLSARLGELGVTSFAQIAGWSDADLARIDGALGPFAGRPARDDWIAQCRFLAAGNLAGYEAQFGRL